MKHAMKYVIGAVLGIMLGGGIEFEAGKSFTRQQVAFAFGCGRVYADNKDPALDAADDQSPCYPAYKAWDATEKWPPK